MNAERHRENLMNLLRDARDTLAPEHQEYVDKLLRDIPTMEDAAFRGVFLEVMTGFVDAFWGAP